MRNLAFAVLVLPAITGCQLVAGASSDPLCKPLRKFVASVGPGAEREVVFYTSWGSGFKGDTDESLYEKRCTHEGYEPAKPLCNALMGSGAVEFSGNNVKRTPSCLSDETRFAARVQLERGEFEFNYGTDNRGQVVKVSFDEDSDLGAMALRVTAHGY